MKKIIEKLSVITAGIISACYLLNIGAGVIEVIPDVVPVFGNLDEAAAMTILLGVLAYFGFDVTRLFRGSGKAARKATPEVVDVDARTSEP